MSNKKQETYTKAKTNSESVFQEINRGVGKGCVPSPDFFNLCIEMILRELEDIPEVIVDGGEINNDNADDTILIAEKRKYLQNLLNVFKNEDSAKRLELNSRKQK